MFKGLGGIGNIGSIMGAMQSLPDKMKELNERMQAETVTASSSCSSVTVIMTCVGRVESVAITNDDLDVQLTEKAVLEATNAAGALAKQTYAAAISQMASEMDLNIPGIDGLISSIAGNG